MLHLNRIQSSRRTAELLLRTVSLIAMLITSVAFHSETPKAADNDGRKSPENGQSQPQRDQPAANAEHRIPTTAGIFIQQAHVPYPSGRILPNGDIHQLTILESQIYAAASSGSLAVAKDS